MLVVFLMVVSAGGVAAVPSTHSSSRVHAVQEPVDAGEADYERVPPELCPPDGAPVEEAVFAGETDFGASVAVFANEQAELFAITVTGPNVEAAQLYIEEARFCFDQIFTGTALEPGAEAEEDEGTPVLDEEMVEADVAIDFAFLGYFPEGDGAVARERVAEFVESGAALEDLPAWLGEGFVDADQLEERGEAWVVDFFVDPAIQGGWRHSYTALATSGNVTVYGKGGRIRAYLYIYVSGLYLKDSTDIRGVTSDKLNASSLSLRSFRLCVEGVEASNRYALAGRWTIGASSTAPSSATKGNCP
jgi:hypothetical protein